MPRKLVDIAKINVKAGDGGAGRVSFRREKYIPKGGPDGGDGGNGGSIFFVGDHNMATLLDFRSKTKYKAENGSPGGAKKMSGKGGEDLFIKLPVGTLIYQIKGDSRILIGDITGDGDECAPYLVARGGMGGKGNTRFKSSTNQAPTQFTPGTKGDLKEIELELKLVADVGLIGLPNAGKSTLINTWAGTNAKTASYPFTTLYPNLGHVKLKSGQDIILADIPGLVSGASKGKGLGDDFLRHVERTRVLIHIIDPLFDIDLTSLDSVLPEGKTLEDVFAEQSVSSYKAIRKELEEYNEDLLLKPEIVVINKIDVTEVRGTFERIKVLFKEMGIQVIGISAYTGENLDELINRLIDVLSKAPGRKKFMEMDERQVKVYTIDNLPNKRILQN